ncbi:MAG: tetratricopeptide repeat protein [Bacteroidota bacterium]
MAQINAPKPAITYGRGEESDDLLQSGFAQSSDFFEDNRNLVIGAGVGLLVLAIAAVLFFNWRQAKAAEGQEYLGAILTEYEIGNYQAALDGTDAAPGLLDLAEDYSSTPTGDQARFFAADAYLQLGQTQEALEMFESYEGGGILGASALAGQASIKEGMGEHAEAAALYERAAGAYPEDATAPGYLLDAARAYGEAGDTEAAMTALQTLLDEYGDAPELIMAEMEMGRLQARTAG